MIEYAPIGNPLLLCAALILFLLGFLGQSSQGATDHTSVLERLATPQKSQPFVPHLDANEVPVQQVQQPAESQTRFYGSWSLTCKKQEVADACFVFQIVRDARMPDGKISLKINGPDPNGAKGTLTLPTGFLFEQGVVARIGDHSSVVRFVVAACLPDGCVASVELNQDQLALLQTSTYLDLAITNASGEAIYFLFDLRGFGLAFEQMSSTMSR